MSFNCIMKTDKNLMMQEIEQDLKEIIHRKFDDILNLETYTENINGLCTWNIRYDEIYYCPVFLKRNNQLVFDHPDNSWSIWLQHVFEEELSLKYHAQLQDDEYPHEKLKLSHLTFISYLEDLTSSHSKQWKQALIFIELSCLPSALKKF